MRSRIFAVLAIAVLAGGKLLAGAAITAALLGAYALYCLRFY